MSDVQRPQPTGRAMTTDAHEELYRVLLDSAELAPLNVLAQEIEVLVTVLTRRLNDEMGEFEIPTGRATIVVGTWPDDPDARVPYG